LVIAEQHLGANGLGIQGRRIDWQARVQAEQEAAIGIDVAIDQRGDAAQVLGVEMPRPRRFGQNLLDYQGIEGRNASLHL